MPDTAAPAALLGDGLQTTESVAPPQRHSPSRRLAACVFVAAYPLLIIAVLRSDFSYKHGWVSAHFATIARTFASVGIWQLGGLPVQNNLPLTNEPDFYLNWPPLFGMVLSLAVRVIGASPIGLHLVSATITIMSALAIGFALERLFGTAVGSLAAAAFLLMPVTLRYGFGVFHISLALLFLLLALVTWNGWLRDGGKTRLIFAGILFFLAVMTSWEPLLALPGLLAASLFDERRLRALRGATVPALGATLGFLAVASMYLTQIPWAAEQLRARMIERAGLSDYAVSAFRVHGIEEYFEPSRALTGFLVFLKGLYQNSALIGPPALIALAVAMIVLIMLRRDEPYRRALHLLLPLLSLFFIWAFAMRRHFYLHEYEWLIAAPPGAVALGIAVAFMRDCAATVGPAHRQILRALYLRVLPVLLVVGGAGTFMHTLFDHSEQDGVIFGKFIARHTDPGAIVVTPERSMVPVYYAERHVIRSVTESVIVEHRANFEALCRDCPQYLALRDADAPRFQSVLADSPIEAREDGFAIYRLQKARADRD